MVWASSRAPMARTVGMWAGKTVKPSAHSLVAFPAAATMTAPEVSARWSAASSSRVSRLAAR